MEFSLHEATLPGGQYLICIAGRRASRKPSILFSSLPRVSKFAAGKCSTRYVSSDISYRIWIREQGSTRLSSSAACFRVVPLTWSYHAHDCMQPEGSQAMAFIERRTECLTMAWIHPPIQWLQRLRTIRYQTVRWVPTPCSSPMGKPQLAYTCRLFLP